MVKFLSRLLMKLASQRRPAVRRNRRQSGESLATPAADVALWSTNHNGRSTRREKVAALASMQRLETRTLLVSTLNGLADGRLIYGGSGVANNLTISFDGTNYSLNDTGETITLLGTVAGIGAGSGTNTVTFNPALLATFTTFIINNGANNDTINVNGFRGGQEGLDVQDVAGQGTDILNINTNLGSAGSRLQRPAQLLSETLNLGGSVFTNNQTVNLASASAAVSLTANATVDAGTGTVGSTSTINGANSLTVQGGSVQLTGIIGGVTPLTDVSLTSTGAGAMQVPAITDTGDISITSTGVTNLRGNLTAGDDITITAASTSSTVAAVALATGGAAGNDINVTGAISGTQSLNLNAGGGNIVVGGNIGLTGAASLNATANSVDFNGSTSANSGITITTVVGAFVRSLTAGAGNVTVNGDVTFDGVGSVTNSAGTTSTMLFTGNIIGNGGDLNLRGAQTVTVQGAINAVATLSVAKGGVGAIVDATLNNANAQTISVIATNIHAQGDLTATIQTVALTGAVVLDGADPTVTITSGLGVGDSITVTGTINDAGAATALELIAANDTNVNLDGAVTVTGAIGGVAPIQSLRVNGATVTLQAVDVTTGNIRLGGGTLFLNGNLSGSGVNNNVIFAPNGVGGTLEIYNQATAPISNNMTVDTTDLSRLTASIERVVFGDNATATVTLVAGSTGFIVIPRNSEFRGGTVNLGEIINQGAFTVDIFTDTLNIPRSISGTGAVTLNKLTLGGTLLVNGNFAQSGWGASNVTINNLAGNVTINGHLGGINVASLTINTQTLDTTSQPSAIESNGDVTLNVTTLMENGGVFSTTGNVVIGGNVVSTAGPLTFLIPAGNSLQIAGTVNAAGTITIRGRGGAIASVAINGTVTTTGALQIDSSGANTAALVNLAAVNAGSINVRGTQINLNGNLTATAGSVQLTGAVGLLSNVVMTSSGLATHFVRVDGAIDGGFNLESQSGLGQTHLVGVIGGVTPVNNLLVRAGGSNFVYDNITANGTVDWKSGDTNNAGQDLLTVQSGKTITAGTAIIIEADTVFVNQVTQLFAPVKTVISNGAP